MLKEIIYKIFGIEDVCRSCDTLRHQIDVANHEKRLLLDSILSLTNPTKHDEEVKEYESIPPRNIPWHVKREMLEEADRTKAKIKKLEEEVGVAEDADKK